MVPPLPCCLCAIPDSPSEAPQEITEQNEFMVLYNQAPVNEMASVCLLNPWTERFQVSFGVNWSRRPQTERVTNLL